MALGWNRERVIVIDEDQGRSAAVAQARVGFARLVAAVARGEVGIVMSLEISRLSRNDADWHHLVYLCRWTGTVGTASSWSGWRSANCMKRKRAGPCRSWS